MAYDLTQFQALTSAHADELNADGLPVLGQPTDAVDLWFWRPSATYDVAYKPTDAAPPPKRQANHPPPKGTGDKAQPKRADANAPKSHSADHAPRRRTDDRPSPKYNNAERQINTALDGLGTLQKDLETLAWRVQHLNPKIQAMAVTGEVRIDLEHMMEQLNELNREVQKDRDRFELVMAEKYGPLAKRIESINRKLTELEHPEPAWSDIRGQLRRLLHIDQWP